VAEAAGRDAETAATAGRTPGTTLAGVIGDPVAHSLSPRIHQAAYAALGLDWVYVAFEVPAPLFGEACSGARALGLRGLSVTMPHKEAAAAFAVRRSPVVRRLGAANTLTFGSKGAVADSTDGDGLLDDLREGAGFSPEGRRCGVVGAGGAARAAVLALAGAGASEVLVVNRTAARAFRAAALAPGRARVTRPEELDGCDLVVQATPATMTERAEGLLIDPGRFGSGQLVYDLVYLPAAEAFWAPAAANGAKVRTGLGMLVHQAARQVRLWTGCVPPLPAMWEAVRPGAEPPAGSAAAVPEAG